MAAVFATFVAMMAVSAPCEKAFAGTRPGSDGEPLTPTGTLILLDVAATDGATESFTADLFLELEWRDERLAVEGEGIRRLPLDRHRFKVQLAVPGYGPDEIAFVPATQVEDEERAADLTVPDWSIGSFELRSAPFEIVRGGRTFAGLEGELEASRRRGFFIGQGFVSVAIIIFMSWVVFWIGPPHFGPRLSVAVTSMLTLVAYRFLLDQPLPSVSYLTRLDG
jgi:hypothetical protein